MTAPGLVVLPSPHGPAETMDRLAAAVGRRGLAVLARIDHGAGAAEAGLPLGPMEVLVFGNPRAGTPLMQKAPTLGIDLPLRALVWQDEAGRTWLAYNDPRWLAERHGAGGEGSDKILAAMTAGLAAVAREATAGEDAAPPP